MNFRTTLILLVVLLGLGTFVFVANRGSDSDKPPETPSVTDVSKGRKLFEAKADDIEKLSLRPAVGAPAGAKPLELAKSAGKWNLVQPVAWPAEAFDTRSIIE